MELADRASNRLEVLAGANNPVQDPGFPADPAAAAIARAVAARAQDATMSPLEKARNQLESLEQRLEKTRARLAAGRDSAEDPKIIEALESTVTRLEEKVSATRDQLHSMEGA